MDYSYNIPLFCQDSCKIEMYLYYTRSEKAQNIFFFFLTTLIHYIIFHEQQSIKMQMNMKNSNRYKLGPIIQYTCTNIHRLSTTLNNPPKMSLPALKEKAHEPPKSALKIKVNEQKCHSTFLCAEHFCFQDRHLFSCIDPLHLCYQVLNMGRVALF